MLEYKGQRLLGYILDMIHRNIDILVSCNRKFEADFRRWQLEWEEWNRRSLDGLEVVFLWVDGIHV